MPVRADSNLQQVRRRLAAFSFERSRVDAPHDDAQEHRVRADPPRRPRVPRWLEEALPIADHSLTFHVASRTPSTGSLAPPPIAVHHRRRSADGARLARFTRSAAHRFRIRESAAGCPGMSDVVSCVRESYFSDVPRARPALVVAGGSVPISPTGRIVVRVNEDDDCQSARHVVGSPFGTSARRCRRHVGPTSAAHI